MYVDTVVLQLGGRNPGHLVEPSPKVMTDKGVSIGRFPLPSRVTSGIYRFPITNFSSPAQFIPAGMVVGKILPIVEIVEDVHVGYSGAPTNEMSLPFPSRVNKDIGNDEWEKTISLLGNAQRTRELTKGSMFACVNTKKNIKIVLINK